MSTSILKNWMWVAVQSSAATGYNMSNLVVSSQRKLLPSQRDHKTASPKTLLAYTQNSKTSVTEEQHSELYVYSFTVLLNLSDRTCLFSSIESNISSTKHTVTYQLLQSISSGVITPIYSVTSLTQLCPIPLTENKNRAEQIHICGQLQKKVKQSLLQNVSIWWTWRICVESEWLQKKLWKY